MKITKQQWPQVKGKLQQAYPNLTDSDLQFSGEGDSDQLVQRIAQKTGARPEEIRRHIES